MKKCFNLTLLLIISTFSYTQDTASQDKIQLIPSYGNVAYRYQDSIYYYEEDIAKILISSDCPQAVRQGKKYNRKHAWAQVFLTVGGSASGIWLVNELLNPEFHTDLEGAALWRTLVIAPAIFGTSTCLFFFNREKKNINKGIEAFNNHKASS